jgi:signal transduction histidine kinase
VIRRGSTAPTLEGVRLRDVLLHHPRLRLPVLADAVITAAVLGWTLLMIGGGGLGTPDPSARALDPTGVVLSFASGVPLLLRRLFPGTVYAVTAIATLVLLALRYPVDIPLGAAVSAYSLSVAYGAGPAPDRRPTGGVSVTRRRVALLAVLAFIPTVTVIYATAGIGIWDLTTELLSWLGIFAGIWLIGDRARLRREQLGHLREQVARAQHDAERERRLAVAEERTRIARELHDSAGHAINVILVQAGAARLLYDRDPGRSRAALATIEDVARATIGDIDRMVRALRDDDESAEPTHPGALEELIARHRDTGLDIETCIDGPWRPLPDSVAWATYRIVQEALTNAARHGSGQADVAVRPGPDAVEISVTNPTRPVAAGEPATPGGHGIIGMRERASLLGGTLETTEHGGTFRLRARLPLTGAAR